MQCVEQVCFTHAIFTANANDPPGEIEFLVLVILKLGERYGGNRKHQLCNILPVSHFQCQAGLPQPGLTPNSTRQIRLFPLFLRLKIKPVAAKFSKETYLYWYELMQLIRQFELMAEEKYKMEGKIRGFFHAYIGQEAIAAGCMTATKPEDSFVTGYRDHGLAIAKGVDVNSCMAELYGKATGCAKGKGGSMHFFGKEVNFFGGHGIVGAQIGTGAGLAFAEQYKGTDNVSLCFFGDGAARQGILHETFNLAMLWKLPVIFICENNNYAMGTSVERTSNVIDIYKLADAYEMPADAVDGMSAEGVHEAVARAVKRAREKGGPTLLEMKTYRYKGHSISDPQKYRTKEEVDEYKEKDPIQLLLKTILANKFAKEEDIKAINDRVDAMVAESVKFAEESPWPDDSEVLKDVYVDQNYPFIVD